MIMRSPPKLAGGTLLQASTLEGYRLIFPIADFARVFNTGDAFLPRSRYQCRTQLVYTDSHT